MLRLACGLLAGAVLACLVAGALLDHGLMTETLTRRGVTAIGDHHADVLASTPVGEVMSADVVVVRDDLSVDEARAVVGTAGHHAFPVVDGQGRCVGVVSRADLLEAEDAGAPVLDVAGVDVVAVAPTTPVLEALHLMLLESVDHLPVLDGDAPVGICTRTDVLTARLRQLDAERPQPGWAPWQGRSRSLPSLP